MRKEAVQRSRGSEKRASASNSSSTDSDKQQMPVEERTASTSSAASAGPPSVDSVQRQNASKVLREMVEVNTSLDLLEYTETNRAELQFIVEMLSTFHGYRDLPAEDKVALFKHFWIHFVILERTYDSYRVLGTNPDDLRMVFSNGIIVNVLSNERIDISKVTDVAPDQVGPLCQPWFRTASHQILPSMKSFQPTEAEIAYCFGLQLFSVNEDIPLSVGTVKVAHEMVEVLHSELYAYYVSEFPGQNYVRRIAELMRFMQTIQKIVLQRKEDILLSKVFNVFKFDIFLDEIFNSD
ncbi:CRE-NHR-45 protein [Aphelenchoides avenae]|nr:CRE-NHR-45 protein [Aphelenchus avenae]